MDKALDEKLSQLTDIARKMQVVSEDMKEKQSMIDEMTSVKGRLEKLPTVVEAMNDAIIRLEGEVSEDQAKLEELKAQL